MITIRNRSEHNAFKFETSRMNHLFANKAIGDSFDEITKEDSAIIRAEAWRWKRRVGESFSVKKDPAKPGYWICTRTA